MLINFDTFTNINHKYVLHCQLQLVGIQKIHHGFGFDFSEQIQEATKE